MEKFVTDLQRNEYIPEEIMSFSDLKLFCFRLTRTGWTRCSRDWYGAWEVNCAANSSDGRFKQISKTHPRKTCFYLAVNERSPVNDNLMEIS